MMGNDDLLARVTELEKEKLALKEELIKCGVDEGWKRILEHDDYASLERALGTYESDEAVSTSMDDQLDAVRALVAERNRLRALVEDLENQLCLQGAIMEAVMDALDGHEPSEFMLSFPDVYRAWFIYRLAYPRT